MLPYTHMKTTVEIPDAVLERLRRRADREGTTLKALIQAAIQRFLAGDAARPTRFTLRDGSVGGRGPAAGVQEGRWETIRDTIYAGRGA
jgi:hypothetical protein